MMKYLFSSLRIVLAFVFVFWILSVIKFFFEAPLSILFGFSVVLSLLFLKKTLLIGLIKWINNHKILFSIFMVIYQIVILISTAWMIRSDAASVYRAATHLQEVSITEAYFSRYPNNLLLLIYERAFFNIFGLKSALWVMQFLNIVYLNTSLFLIYKLSKKHFSLQAGNITYFLSVFLIGFSPQFIAMYTDIMLLPIIVFQLYLMVDLFKGKKGIKGVVGLALVSAVGILIRPTSLILIIAIVIVFLLRHFSRHSLNKVILLILVIIGLYKSFDYLKSQQTIVNLKKEDSITALAYIDLGLTYTGADQIDFQRGLSMFVRDGESRFSNRVVKKDIQRRIDEYTPISFINHIILKFNNTVKDGTLQWVYRSPLPGDNLTILNPLLKYTENNIFAKIVRKFFIEIDSKYFSFYKYSQQIVWTIASLGLLLNIRYIRKDDINDTLLLTIFGGLMFLMIFEGGKTRYLIQFLPEILLVSSLGLSAFLQKMLPDKDNISVFR